MSLPMTLSWTEPASLFPAVLADLGIEPEGVRCLGDGGPPASRFARASESRAPDLGLLARELGPADVFLYWIDGQPSAAVLAAARNALWPLLHVIVLYRADERGFRRTTLSGSRELEGSAPAPGVLIAARRSALVLAPEATVEKFDLNASGWNGEPEGPGYAHFRWMRRHVAHFARTLGARRILDFGCGAGWVGIEAALRAHEASLAAFDPSPAMVQIATENARAQGLTRFESRVGFGEDPPFPAHGEPAFDLVLSSGVISFSPDPERWLDGLARTVAPGGTLVVGDIHGASHGMRERKRTRPLLPVRELNAQTREAVRAGLERRGFRFEAWSGYQLSWPLPQLMHANETKLGGLLTQPLLWTNQLASALDLAFRSPGQSFFDSWVMRLRRA